MIQADRNYLSIPMGTRSESVGLDGDFVVMCSDDTVLCLPYTVSLGVYKIQCNETYKVFLPPK